MRFSNAQLPGSSETFCPNCGDEVISRIGYSARGVGLSGRNCSNCGSEIKFVGKIFEYNVRQEFSSVTLTRYLCNFLGTRNLSTRPGINLQSPP